MISGTAILSQRISTQRIARRRPAAVHDGPPDVGLPATIVKTDYNNFAPRFGFAWRAFGGNRP